MTLVKVRLGIRAQESGGNYRAINPKSDNGNGAYGAYQYIDGTWGRRFGVRHASEATPAQQDQAAIADLKTLYEDPLCQHDWERVIASWFAGPQGQAGPKTNWGRSPDGTGSYNPEIGEYVAGVIAHSKEI